MNSTKTKARLISTNRGFTLVEVIIVIAVIVILASIVTVSYRNTQDQVKAETARANAGSVEKAAQAYYNVNNRYPTQRANFGSTFVTMPSNITILNSGTLSRANGENSILYRYISSGAGACVMYWDFMPVTGSPGIKVYGHLGTATSANCNATCEILTPWLSHRSAT